MSKNQHEKCVTGKYTIAALCAVIGVMEKSLDNIKILT